MEQGTEKAGEQRHRGLGQVWAKFGKRPAGPSQVCFGEQEQGTFNSQSLAGPGYHSFPE